MLRSFDYAAYSELLTLHPATITRRVRPARALGRDLADLDLGRVPPRVPGSRRPRRPAARPTTRRACRLLDFFMLEKTLFELQYELNYRPDWVAIPLLGILHLIRPARAVGRAGSRPRDRAIGRPIERRDRVRTDCPGCRGAGRRITIARRFVGRVDRARRGGTTAEGRTRQCRMDAQTATKPGAREATRSRRE